MCTTFCKCPGAPGDEHYMQYKEIKPFVYEKYDRYFKVTQKPDESINDFIERQQKELQWLPIADTNTRLTTNTMLECFNNSQAIAIAVA